MSFKERCIKALNMQYLEGEGGYFCEIYRANDQKLRLCDEDTTMTLQKGEWPNEKVDHDVKWKYRDLYTTIYYLIEKVNRPVALASDNIHFYHDGCPVKYYWIEKGSKELKEVILGRNLTEGHRLQLLVPKGALKWAVVLDDGVNDKCALLSECVTPGFDFKDRTMYSKEELQSKYPEHWSKIQEAL